MNFQTGACWIYADERCGTRRFGQKTKQRRCTCANRHARGTHASLPTCLSLCSNPLELTRRRDELATDEWGSVFKQAAELGVLHLHLSGGEPAARGDLADLTTIASSAGLYTNLITSGIGLTRARVTELAAAGLNHIQLSIQAAEAELADRIGNIRNGHARKMMVAGWIREVGIPLTINAVCHRQNMHQVEDMIVIAIALGARRIEIATVQFHGWAERNRAMLMPTRAQVEQTTALVERASKELEGILVIDYVPADHHARFPKACMGGWGRTGLNITPAGRVLPCHAAETIPSLEFDNVRDRSLEDIWYHGSAFNKYRGKEWMQEPCRSCARKHIDFGGCRCQALALAGCADATDPVCIRSPVHQQIVARAQEDSMNEPFAFVYRVPPS